MLLTKKFNQLVKAGLFLSVSVGAMTGNTQSLTLEDCYQKAELHSPLKRQEQYLATIDELNRSISQGKNLPTFDFQARATYQSDVFALPFSPPGSEVPEIPKDQYQLNLNVTQKIYDGGINSMTRKTNQAELQSRRDQLKVSLYQIRNVINEVYFSILMMEENRTILKVAIKEIDNRYKIIQSGVRNGILLPSALKFMEKERLRMTQELQQMELRESAFRIILSEWIGEEVIDQRVLEIPGSRETSTELYRPELQVFSSQKEVLEMKQGQLSAYSRPRVMAFATLGLGSPNPYNFFETDWSDYYLIGGRLEWRIWDWNENRKQRQILAVNQDIILSEQEHFERGIHQQQVRTQSEIRLLEHAIETDRRLYVLQKEITDEAASRLEQGVITTSDYLTELNNLTQAEITLAIHQLELLKTQTELLTISGMKP